MMGYVNQEVDIKLGMGLRTDDPQSDIPPGSLIRATNITLENGICEKGPGSLRWNQTALGSGVRAFYDFWPNDYTQRVVVLESDGTVTKFTDPYTSSEITGDALSVPEAAQIVEGGNETAGADKKLFIFTGNSQVQVISGDDDTRAAITHPAEDWASSYPSFGVSHRGRIWAFGNKNRPHNIYASDFDDHEDFRASNGDTLTFNVYPGDGDALIGGYVFKGRLFVFKSPRSMYILEDTDADTDNWFFRKLNDDFGSASPNAAVGALDGLVVANQTGSITSLTAAFELGDVKSADILNNLRCEQYMRETSTQHGLSTRYAMYYPDKKQVYFAYQTVGSSRNNALLVLDLNNSVPKVVWWLKDQPSCLGLIRDYQRIARPIYGSDDGYLYQMDRPDRIVGVQISAPGALTCALAGIGSGSLTNGVYSYKVTYVTNNGETTAGTTSSTVTVTDATTDGQIQLTAIPTSSDLRVFGRKIYRTTAGGSTYKLVALLSDNVSTTYLDNIPDAGLGDTPPSTNTTLGFLGEFQIAYTDLGTSKNKNFQFLEVHFESCGNYAVYCDVYIDGIFSQTLDYRLYYGVPLDSLMLDSDQLIGRAERTQRKPISGRGRSVSFRFYNHGDYETFKISKLTLGFQVSDEGQKAQTS